MANEEKKILTDILIAIETIFSYIGEPKVYEAYHQNHLLQGAVERNLIIVGEAVNQILKTYPLILISNARKIVDVRNRLTHGYNDIDDVQIWNIIINHLPILK